jgi:hypothetical protein
VQPTSPALLAVPRGFKSEGTTLIWMIWERALNLETIEFTRETYSIYFGLLASRLKLYTFIYLYTAGLLCVDPNGLAAAAPSLSLDLSPSRAAHPVARRHRAASNPGEYLMTAVAISSEISTSDLGSGRVVAVCHRLLTVATSVGSSDLGGLEDIDCRHRDLHGSPSDRQIWEDIDCRRRDLHDVLHGSPSDRQIWVDIDCRRNLHGSASERQIWEDIDCLRAGGTATSALAALLIATAHCGGGGGAGVPAKRDDACSRESRRQQSVGKQVRQSASPPVRQ